MRHLHPATLLRPRLLVSILAAMAATGASAGWLRLSEEPNEFSQTATEIRATSPDGEWIVYTARYLDSSFNLSIISVPSAGGERIHHTPIATRAVEALEIVGDRLVFELVPVLPDDIDQIWSSPLDGSEPAVQLTLREISGVS